MKVLFYINSIHEGGAERVMVNLSDHFAKCGCAVVFVTSFVDSWEYPLNPNIKRLSLEQEQIKCGFLKRNYIRIKNLRKICKVEKPDVVVSFMGENNFRAILATRGLKTKTIVSVRNDPDKEYPTKLFKFLAKTLYKKADGVVFQTEEAKKWFSKKIQSKSCIIMNQVADVFFETKRKDERYYVATGRLNQQKNYSLMIKAFARFTQIYPREKLYIFGNGELEVDLQKLINSLNVSDNIFLKGQSDDIPKVLSQAKGFLLSSDYEGMPNGLLEAMAVGVPCISTDCPCGGPKMIIEPNKNGVLIKIGDETSLFENLCKLEEDIEFRNLISQKAKEKAKEFKPEVIFKQWKSYLEDVIKK